MLLTEDAVVQLHRGGGGDVVSSRGHHCSATADI